MNTIVLPAGLTIPDEFAHRFVREELHEEIPVTVTRYQRTPHLAYGGEHVTTVIGADNGTLYGYTRQVATDDEAALPDPQTARKAAFEFLNEVDASYAAGLDEQWIDRHDEQVTTESGGPATVAGIKVKTKAGQTSTRRSRAARSPCPDPTAVHSCRHHTEGHGIEHRRHPHHCLER